ncbi:MAG TPA: nucleoside 2-deoxyribosyltransferase [Phycisphaerae bacterium]|nr:nucleoside 2-deoxyribosyltransferase [Phycisphaerae bacterium]
MASPKHTIYCAGPLFNAKEREEMADLATALEKAHFGTFLPQRDGLELTVCVKALTKRGMGHKKAAQMVGKAIFALDVYQVVKGCQGILVNLNGRVPDEGAVSEAAIAWSAGKAVVGYKADGRSVFLGEDNPLVAGLFNFDICCTIRDAVQTMVSALASPNAPRKILNTRRKQLKGYLRLGEQIWAAMHYEDKIQKVAEVLQKESLVPAASAARSACLASAT